MKPIKFPESNVIFAENQPPYIPLPALALDSPEGHVCSCWNLSIKERIKLLFTGKMWVSVMTFNRPIQPIILSVNQNDVFVKKTE